MDELIVEYVKHIMSNRFYDIQLVKCLNTEENYLLFKEDMDEGGRVIKLSPETAEMLIKDLGKHKPIYVDWVGDEDDYFEYLEYLEELEG